MLRSLLIQIVDSSILQKNVYEAGIFKRHYEWLYIINLIQYGISTFEPVLLVVILCFDYLITIIISLQRQRDRYFYVLPQTSVRLLFHNEILNVVNLVIPGANSPFSIPFHFQPSLTACPRFERSQQTNTSSGWRELMAGTQLFSQTPQPRVEH